jgi:hypothetical protein
MRGTAFRDAGVPRVFPLSLRVAREPVPASD